MDVFKINDDDDDFPINFSSIHIRELNIPPTKQVSK